MVHFLFLLAALSADGDLGARVDLLKHHVERLNAITVTQDVSVERAERLKILDEAVANGASTVEEYNALYNKIDEVRIWLWANAADKPKPADGSYAEADTAWNVTTPALSFSVSKADLALHVKTAAAVWDFLPCNERDIEMNGGPLSLLSAKKRTVEEFRTGYSVGLLITLQELPDAPGMEFRLCISATGKSLVCEVAAVDNGVNFVALNWPKAIKTGNTASDVEVIPHMQGMLLPGNWPTEVHQQDLVNSRTLYMPWWGHLRGGVRGKGPGAIAILETSDDGGVTYDHPVSGPTVVTPRWYASLCRVGYQRVIRYVFDDSTDYVGLAKIYRNSVMESGRFVTLREKLVRSPQLNEVIGRPVIHIGALYHFVREASLFNKEHIEANHSLNTFDELAQGLRALKASGVDDAYVHLDGWEFYGYDNGHPDVLPPGKEQGGWNGLRGFANTCDELGYLFAVHDQYRDFYLNAVSFNNNLVAQRTNGSREEHSTWCGGPQTILSPRFAPEYVRRNHDFFAANGVKVKGAYLDVFSIVPLEESFEPAHPISRSECARYRGDCFDLLRARGYVVSSEEPTDYLAPHLDLVHHGPYATSPHIGGGDARGIPVPLWSLVYHDALLLPWDMGEDGGWGIPKGDAGFLHCFLNAGMPYLGLGADAAHITRMKEAAALNARCAFSEMASHEFLDDTLRKQRTTYSDGTTVTVNLTAKTYTIEPK